MTSLSSIVESAFRLAAARHILGSLTTADARSAANVAVDHGVCSPAVIELGIPREPHTQDVQRQFLVALHEVGGVLPARDEAEHTVLRDLMSRIANGGIAPRDGAAELFELHRQLVSAKAPERYVGEARGIAELIGYARSYTDLDERADVSSTGSPVPLVWPRWIARWRV